MPTLPGQSGCPIIEIKPDRSLAIVGVHKGTATININEQKMRVNIARMINFDLITTLKNEVMRSGA